MRLVESRVNADTRDRILDAAEELFAENGFDATSMRMITARARCNLAAVNYHFGTKETLLQEVFRRRLTDLNRGRVHALDAMEAAAAGEPLKPQQIVESFFGTALRMAADTRGGGARFMRLLGRTHSEPAQFIRSFLAEEHAAVIERFKAALVRALPDVPHDEIVWRLHFMLGAVSYAMAGTDALRLVTDCDVEDHDPAKMAPRLMAFLLGGLRAPLPEVSNRPPASRAAPAKPKKPRRAA